MIHFLLDEVMFEIHFRDWLGFQHATFAYFALFDGAFGLWRFGFSPLALFEPPPSFWFPLDV